MIVGIGCDVVEQKRVTEALEKYGDRFVQRLLTASEIRIYEKRLGLSRERGLSFLASRWAVKEAISKALGTGISGDVTFHAMAIMHTQSGAPMAVFSDSLKERLQREGIFVHITITDEKTVAAAFAVAEQRSEVCLGH